MRHANTAIFMIIKQNEKKNIVKSIHHFIQNLILKTIP